jgi:hypothetical protein
MDRDKLEQKLRDHFKNEVRNIGPSSGWWENIIAGLGEQKGDSIRRRVFPAVPTGWRFSTAASNGRTRNLATEAVFSPPGNYYLKLTLNGLTNEYISINGKKYVQDSEALTGWNVVFNTSFIPDKESTLEVLGQIIDVRQLPDEKIDNVNCFHYRGRYPDVVEDMIAQSKSQLTEEQIRQMEKEFDKMRSYNEVDIWISQEDYFLRQEQVRAWNTAGQDIRNYTTRLFDFNQPVTINPPMDASGQLLPGWRLEADMAK